MAGEVRKHQKNVNKACVAGRRHSWRRKRHRPSRISWPKLGNTGLSPKNGGKLQKGFKQISKTRFAFSKGQSDTL